MINKDNRRSASWSGRGRDSNIPKISYVWDGKLMKYKSYDWIKHHQSHSKRNVSIVDVVKENDNV